MRNTIRFLRNGKIVELADVSPTATVLDYLRLTERACGTKEGCAEGDCGACTIAMGSSREGRLVYEPVMSCIQLLGQIDGKAIVAVDDLDKAEGRLHAVQDAMVRFHGSQCGFCTPGFVMSLFTLYHAGVKPSREIVNDWLAGNLCRCTGYRPIVDAAFHSCKGEAHDSYAANTGETLAALQSIASSEDVFIGDAQNFLAIPASIETLADLYVAHPDAVLLSGATDVGLWITKQLRPISKMIFLQNAGLDRIEERDDALILGATVTYAKAQAHLAGIDPDLGELVRRLGSKQVRAAGTIGGNIANGSPIGDMPPALIALDATLELRHGNSIRTMPLENFFLSYGRQDRKPGEFATRVMFPKLKPGQRFRCYKISKRFDQDISALLGAFRFDLNGSTITAARVAFGGMAATPKRATRTEAGLAGVDLNDRRALVKAQALLAEDYQPISDHRASAAYRMATAGSLLEKALREIAAGDTRSLRLIGLREASLGRVA